MYLLTVLVTLAIASGISGKPSLRQSNPQTDPFLDLTVSAKGQKVQIVWKNLDVNGRFVLRNGPELGSQTLLEQTVGTSNGWMDTSIAYNYNYFRGIITSTTSCYGYFIDYYASASSTKADISACMMAYPRWMQDMRSVIGSRSFREVLVPGSHDSAAYKANYNLATDETIVNKYVLTQDEDIRGQLLAGVRYLDIRPAYYAANPIQFWVNHGVFQVQPLGQVLQDVYNFVKETNEIVIVNLGEFPVGFNSLDIHRQLVAYVNATIGDQLVVKLPKQWNVTLNKIWNNSDRRIILSYGESTIAPEFAPLTWPSIYGRWANTDNLQTLKDYMYNANNEAISSMTPVADMVEFTPTTMGVIFDQYNGLRKMADNTNPQVSEWYRYDLGFKANIVAMDYIRGTTVIKDSMKWNLNTNRPMAV